jgi:hypothetical protein
VRDGDALAERGAVQTLAVLECLHQPPVLDLGVVRRDHPRELFDDVRLAACFDRGDDLVRGENVGDLHGGAQPSGSISP